MTGKIRTREGRPYRSTRLRTRQAIRSPVSTLLQPFQHSRVLTQCLRKKTWTRSDMTRTPRLVEQAACLRLKPPPPPPQLAVQRVSLCKLTCRLSMLLGLVRRMTAPIIWTRIVTYSPWVRRRGFWRRTTIAADCLRPERCRGGRRWMIPWAAAFNHHIQVRNQYFSLTLWFL